MYLREFLEYRKKLYSRKFILFSYQVLEFIPLNPFSNSGTKIKRIYNFEKKLRMLFGGPVNKFSKFR